MEGPSQIKNFFKSKKILITLGPTREYIDPVRFISNASSGKMGLALADTLKSLGAKVFLVAGPGVCVPQNFSSCSVVSARQMLKAVEQRFSKSDFFVSCAAVSDYRPKKVSAKKIKKGKSTWSLPLILNPDILATVSRRKTKQICVGFSLQDSKGKSALGEAKRKMREKRCDLMVLNSTLSMESDRINATILFSDGKIRELGKIDKKAGAIKLCEAMAQFGELRRG